MHLKFKFDFDPFVPFILTIILGIVFMIMAGCSHNTREQVYSHNEHTLDVRPVKIDTNYAIPLYDNRLNELLVYCLDGHEYIGKVYGYNSDILTHKADCKFCKK